MYYNKEYIKLKLKQSKLKQSKYRMPNNIKPTGFSLIELMVVIAIIAILAAVAVPAYSNYKVRASVSSTMPAIESVVKSVQTYYNKHSSFPTSVTAIGLTPLSGNSFYTDTTNGYFDGNIAFVMVNGTAGAPGTCPYATVAAYISNFGNGDALTNPPGDAILIQDNIIDVNGTLIHRCSSGYNKNVNLSDPTSPVGGTPQSGSYVSDCPNIADDPNYFNDTLALISSCT